MRGIYLDVTILLLYLSLVNQSNGDLQDVLRIADTFVNDGGQLNYKGRTIHYKAKGRVHSFDEPWVYDGVAWDVESGTSVKVKHFKEWEDAGQKAVEKLIVELKQKGLLEDEKPGESSEQSKKDSTSTFPETEVPKTRTEAPKKPTENLETQPEDQRAQDEVQKAQKETAKTRTEADITRTKVVSDDETASRQQDKPDVSDDTLSDQSNKEKQDREEPTPDGGKSQESDKSNNTLPQSEALEDSSRKDTDSKDNSNTDSNNIGRDIPDDMEENTNDELKREQNSDKVPHRPSGLLILIMTAVVGLGLIGLMQCTSKIQGKVTLTQQDEVELLNNDHLNDVKAKRSSIQNSDSQLHQISDEHLRSADMVIDKTIGSGGFSEVYRVTFKKGSFKGHKEAAAKKLNILYENEVLILQKANHPNIVKFLGYVQEDFITCIVTELADESLRDYLDREAGRVPNSLKEKWVRESSEAIRYLHDGIADDNGVKTPVVHRDIKASNCLLFSKRLKVADFGISRQTSHTAATPSHKGTLPWMAPEVLEAQKFSTASDIYALGVLFWEIYTQEKPSVHQEGLRNRHWGQPTNGFRHQFPAHIEKLLPLCWRYNYQERPTIVEIIEQLPQGGGDNSSSTINSNNSNNGSTTSDIDLK